MKAKFQIGDKIRLNGSSPIWIANRQHPTGVINLMTHRGKRRLYTVKLRSKGKGKEYPPFVNLRSYHLDPLVPLPSHRPSGKDLRAYHRRVKRVVRYELGIKVARHALSPSQN